MKLFLLRHTEAEPSGSDDKRALSARGRDTVRELGRFLSERSARLPSTFEHSSLLRARQTAEILAESLGRGINCRERDGLTPSDDVGALAEQLAGEQEDRLWVGHEPHLGMLASLLVCQDPYAGAFAMRKGSLLCLERGIAVRPGSGPFSRWVVNGLVSPSFPD